MVNIEKAMNLKEKYSVYGVDYLSKGGDQIVEFYILDRFPCSGDDFNRLKELIKENGDEVQEFLAIQRLRKRDEIFKIDPSKMFYSANDIFDAQFSGEISRALNVLGKAYGEKEINEAFEQAQERFEGNKTEDLESVLEKVIKKFVNASVGEVFKHGK